EDALALGLTRDEYELVCQKQGGPPNRVELAMYSLLWSEHCAYKHSRKLLRTLPTEGPHVVLGPGENAGAVDVGGGLACAFKVESHNHPSAVEPFQGAATGVGGIVRDIFAIGARPIAVLDSLRFGEPDGARTRYLLEGAVAGIAHYGNSIGVPTVGGEVYFEHPYEHSCLVNVMALGLARRESLVRSAAAGLTSAAAEMASKGGVGVEIDVARVPLREPGMEPFEVMVSESQERMLCVVEPGTVPAVLAACERWEIGGAAIGTVTDTGCVRVLDEGRTVSDMPVAALVDECPLYDIAPSKPSYPPYEPPRARLAADASSREALLALLAAPNLCSRRPLFEHYDAIVQSRTVRRPEQADAAVLALPDGSAL